jgi:hypothetical protein
MTHLSRRGHADRHSSWGVVALCVALAWPGASTAAAQEAPPAVTPGGQAVPAPAPPPPFPNRANDALPAWLQVRGEYRGRMEGFDNAGFTSDRVDLYWLNRFRFDATVKPGSSVAVTLQAQDARVQRKTVGPTGPPFRDVFDLRVAYVDLGGAQRPVSVRVGRQELVFGEQRLVGHVSWVNTARTFDAARLTVRGRALQLDAFASSVVAIDAGHFNKSGHGSWFTGVYAVTSALVPDSVVEPFGFWRRAPDTRTEAGPLDDLSFVTLGGRWSGRTPLGLSYDTEMALQIGSAGTDSVRAWAGHWRARQPIGTDRVRLVGEYNYASGDEDPTDGRRQTFDQLYPTAHDKYGLADQVGWRNIHHVRTGLESTPVTKLQVQGSYHAWWLASAGDALYSAGSAVLARVPGGAASRHVGQEIDVQAAYRVSPQIQVAAGYAHVFPGAFLKEATPGASYSAPYLMVTYVFLAAQ